MKDFKWNTQKTSGISHLSLDIQDNSEPKGVYVYKSMGSQKSMGFSNFSYTGCVSLMCINIMEDFQSS